MSADKRIRFRLHRCLSCWRRGVYVMTLTPEDGNGDPVGEPVQHRICDRHAKEAMDALAPVAEEIGVTLDSGRRIALKRQDDPS